jgi:hypothetical protein
MAKKKIEPGLQKEIFLLITSVELDAFMEINHFSDEDRERIKKIKQDFLEAWVIFYFLNKTNGKYDVDSFMPIYNGEKAFNTAPNTRDVDGVLCLKPLLVDLMIKSWRRDDVENIVIPASRNANWQREYGFGLQEDGMVMAKMDISPSIGVPVTQGYIDFMMNQLKAYQKKALKRPEFTPYVHEIVKEIELMRRELDVHLGFTTAQIAAHDFAIELPSIDGKVSLEFDGDCFLNVFKFLQTCIKKVFPGSGADSVIGLSSFAYSSTVLLVDIMPANNEINPKHQKKAKENVEKVRNTVKEIVSAAPLLVDKGSTEDKLDAFFRMTKIDPVKAAPIVEKLAKVFPSTKAKYGSVKIIVPEKEKVVTLNKEEYLSFLSLNAQLKEQIKPQPKTELSGFLGAVVVWDEAKPKFTIKTDDKKRPTINYEHTTENDKKVRDSIGKYVNVRIVKEGNQLYLAGWL